MCVEISESRLLEQLRAESAAAFASLVAMNAHIMPIDVTHQQYKSLKQGRLMLSATVEPPQIRLEEVTFEPCGTDVATDKKYSTLHVRDNVLVEQTEAQDRTLDDDGHLAQRWQGNEETYNGLRASFRADPLLAMITRLNEQEQTRQ